MEIYLVGGAVRDTLLGLPVTDRDWVVVGSSPTEMTAKGFLPVGKDFPVFLHPVTKEEYALARTERKTGPGYHGFVFDTASGVTLEQDLARRDITINSIAQDSNGRLIDPFGGQSDLAHKVLRHTGSAFAEDPVRVLRVARFAARFADFSVADTTLQLMQDMVAQGEVDALVPERVWQELAKGLMATQPSRMIHLLKQTGALRRLVPALDAMADLKLEALDAAAARHSSLAVRYACLLSGTTMSTAEANPALARVPHACADLFTLVKNYSTRIRNYPALDAAEILDLLTRCDALRRPDRFRDLIEVCTMTGSGDFALLNGALAAAKSMQMADLQDLPDGASGEVIAQALAKARIAAIAAALQIR